MVLCKRQWLMLVAALGLLLSGVAQAAVYNLSLGNVPPCSYGWSVSGSNYQCNGQITLNTGDIIIANQTVNLTANAGFNMAGAIIGDSTHAVNIASSYGNITASGPAEIYGSVTSQSGAINFLNVTVEGDVHSNSNVTLTSSTLVGTVSSDYGTITLDGTDVTGQINTGGDVDMFQSVVDGSISANGDVYIENNSTVKGSISSPSNTVTVIDSAVEGGITANGDITLTRAEVDGLVWSTSNEVIANDSVLLGGATAHSGMEVRGSTLEGDVTMTSKNQLVFDDVIMPSGNITGASSVDITDSELGTAATPVYIRSESNEITVTDSVVYGDLEAPSYDYVYVNDSSIFGTCTPESVPVDACQPGGTAIAAYQATHAAIGLTCEAYPVVLTAVDGSGNTVTPTAGTEVTLIVTGANASWTFTTYTFTGSEHSFTGYLRKTTPGNANFEVGDGTVSVTGSINFVDTGLLIESASGGPLPHIVAGQASTDARLRAVRTDNDTGACVSRVAGGQTVNFGLECRDPGSCIAASEFTVNGSPIGKNNTGNSASRLGVNVTFDGSGVAPLTLNYSDVGEVRLHADLPLAASGNEPAITLSGISSDFVSRPYTLAVVSVTDAGGAANPATTNSGSGFVAAGAPFAVIVESRNANGVATPNFGNENVAEKTSVQITGVVYPAAGVQTPNLAGASAADFSLVGSNTGQQRATNVSWKQVGSASIEPILAGADYLAAGDVAVAGTAVTVGRFYPADIAVQMTNEVTAACGSFSYLGQPFNHHLPAPGLDFELVARDIDGDPVSNYDTAAGYQVTESRLFAYRFNNLTSSWTNISNQLSVDAAQVTVDNAVPEVVLSGPWQSGRLSFTDASATLEPAGTDPAAGFDYWLSVGITDCLDNVSMANQNTHADTQGSCAAPGDNATSLHDAAAFTPDALEARLGRLYIGDAHGPEARSLEMTLVTQYYDGESWRDNLADSCTSIARTDIAYHDLNPVNNQCAATGTDISASLATPVGAASGAYAAIDATAVNWVMGDAQHSFTAPGVAGQFCERINLNTTPWLQFDYDGDGSVDTTATGRIRFGSYRGDDRILFWREVLQ